MSLKKEFIRDGNRRIIGSTTTGYVGSFDTLVRDEHEQHHRTHQREFRHDPRRTWQFGLDQHRRCRSLDRQAQQEVAESVPSNLPPFLPPSWRSSDDTINNADRRHRVPAVFGRRQTEANRSSGSPRGERLRASCPVERGRSLPPAPPKAQPRRAELSGLASRPN